MNATIETVIETRIMDAATGKQVGGNAPKKNLVLDSGLNGIARSTALGLGGFPSSMATYCLIGSGSTANSVANGAVTFTQAATTITASGSFFTSGMVGALFKWGTGGGGVEVYITGFTNATTVTVATSATVSTPSVATVWFVARTTLDSFLFISNTYQTNSGDCGTTISGNQATHKRTYIFSQQASPYTVNEIGYATASVSNRVCGRVVLGSSDVVGITNFYVVVISVTVTYSPSAPASVTNVGTNINTAGTLMTEGMCIIAVNGVGGLANNPSGAGFTILDNQGRLVFKTAPYTQNSSIASTTGVANTNLIVLGTSVWVNDNTKVGSCTMTFTGTLTTTGQTLYGIGLNDGNSVGVWLDVLFTTPQTAPTGTFQPNTVWRLTYTRSLVN